MKHLILGSSGQIGTALCTFLRSKKEEVIEFDIKKNKKYDLRIRENKELIDAIDECDFVYFLAFDVGGIKYLEKHQDTFDFIDNNMLIMSNTFEEIRIQSKPFIFASSPNYPTHSYGMLKRLGEKMTHDLGGVVARFWNVYDREHEEEKAHVITDFIRMAKEEKVIKMRTTGTESRQLLHGYDASRCLYKISNNYISKSTYDITSNKWITIKEVAEIVSKEFIGVSITQGLKEDLTETNSMTQPKWNEEFFGPHEISLEDGIQRLC